MSCVFFCHSFFVFFKQNTAYEMRISDWSSDVCSSDLFEAREKWSRRVSTSALNRWFENAIAKNPPPAPGGRRIKLRYITQAKTRPPTFVVFGNRLDELPESYRRYLVNALRTGLDFDGVPIRLNLRSRTNPFDR